MTFNEEQSYSNYGNKKYLYFFFFSTLRKFLMFLRIKINLIIYFLIYKFFYIRPIEL
jgi:hypothetical protein